MLAGEFVGEKLSSFYNIIPIRNALCIKINGVV